MSCAIDTASSSVMRGFFDLRTATAFLIAWSASVLGSPDNFIGVLLPYIQ
jgi:hypothetical protein